jgi:hypothetical protein
MGSISPFFSWADGSPGGSATPFIFLHRLLVPVGAQWGLTFPLFSQVGGPVSTVGGLTVPFPPQIIGRTEGTMWEPAFPFFLRIMTPVGTVRPIFPLFLWASGLGGNANYGPHRQSTVR